MVVTKELEVELTELKLHGELQMDLYEVGVRGQHGWGARLKPTYTKIYPPGVHSPGTAGRRV